MQSDCKKNRSRSSKTNGTITIELKVKYLEYENKFRKIELSIKKKMKDALLENLSLLHIFFFAK